MDAVTLLPESITERITPGKMEVISIFPMEMDMLVPHAGPQFRYIHPAADRDKEILMALNPERVTSCPPTSNVPYFYQEKPAQPGKGFTRIVFYDTFQLVKDWTQEPPATVKRDIPVQMVVEDMVRCWTSGRLTDSADGGPGIAVYNPKLSLQEQLDNLWTRQQTYFRGLVYQADRLHETKDWANITNLHRKAAEYVGGEDRPWFKPLHESPTKTCPACDTRIARLSIVCTKCGTNIVKFAKEMLELGVKVEDPVLQHLKMDLAIVEKTKEVKK